MPRTDEIYFSAGVQQENSIPNIAERRIRGTPRQKHGLSLSSFHPLQLAKVFIAFERRHHSNENRSLNPRRPGEGAYRRRFPIFPCQQ